MPPWSFCRPNDLQVVTTASFPHRGDHSPRIPPPTKVPLPLCPVGWQPTGLKRLPGARCRSLNLHTRQSLTFLLALLSSPNTERHRPAPLNPLPSEPAIYQPSTLHLSSAWKAIPHSSLPMCRCFEPPCGSGRGLMLTLSKDHFALLSWTGSISLEEQ